MQDVRIDRNKYIGGSDIPVIMGISPFKTRFDLLLEKAGLKENDFEGNAYTEYGNVLEPKIRDYVNEKYGFNFIETKTIIDDCRYHADGDDEEKQCMLEIKTTSQIYENVRDYKLYIVQLLKGMMMKNYKWGKLFVYERPENFDEEFDEKRLLHFNISIDDYTDWCDEINKAVDQFRIDLAKVKENPFITEEELLPIDLTELSNKLVVLENKLAEYKVIETEAKQLKEQLKKAMENNGVKTWETPKGVKITLVPDGEDKVVRKFNEKLFKDNNLDLWDEYSEEVTQKGKAGYVRITLPKEQE